MTPTGETAGQTQYTVREVSAMFEIRPGQIRNLIADGALSPAIGERGRYLFAFHDLVLLRSVARLLKSGVAPRKVRAAVLRLREQLPDEAPITEANLLVAGATVLAEVDSDTWEPDSGQTVFRFDASGTVEELSSVARADTSEERSAQDWYTYADEIEAYDPLEAERSYRNAIGLDPTLSEAHINLGRLLHAAGAVRDALDQYLAAVRIDGGDATTHFNLGVAYQDLGDRTSAVDAYERAIELAPGFTDAAENLSALLDARDHVSEPVNIRDVTKAVSLVPPEPEM